MLTWLTGNELLGDRIILDVAFSIVLRVSLLSLEVASEADLACRNFQRLTGLFNSNSKLSISGLQQQNN